MISLFSGAGGMDRGLELAGFGPTTVQVESDPYASQILARHFPNVTRYTDVRNARNLLYADTVCGGFPCQGNSSAGKGLGLKDPRSGLWSEQARIIGEVRPLYAFVENVASGARRWLPFVRRDLHLLGYRTRALALSAFDCGAPHLRRRVFVLAADPERLELRDEPRWGGRSGGQGADVAVDDGQTWPAPDADDQRELEPRGRVESFWRWARDGDRWTVEPPVPGVAHGIPDRLDRERLAGNACTPQQAEVAGRVMLAWTRKRMREAKER